MITKRVNLKVSLLGDAMKSCSIFLFSLKFVLLLIIIADRLGDVFDVSSFGFRKDEEREKSAETARDSEEEHNAVHSNR